jgi:hypothetical protein
MGGCAGGHFAAAAALCQSWMGVPPSAEWIIPMGVAPSVARRPSATSRAENQHAALKLEAAPASSPDAQRLLAPKNSRSGVCERFGNT